MKEIDICGRLVGADHPPLVIAEVGINHEGELSKALEMVDAAAEAGAEMVKFQCHITENEMIPTDMRPGKISEERLWDIIKRCELTQDEELQVKEYCGKKGIIYFSTPFSREAADRLLGFGLEAFKIGSGECNNYPLIDYIAAMGKPMIVSTGMNDVASVRKTVAHIEMHGTPYALLHCTSMYPTPYDKVRLQAINDLQAAFPGVPIGSSDHSRGIWTALGAVALGATILEKHFTISRDWPGPDTAISIEPSELKDLIEGSRAIWQSLSGTKDVLAEEAPVIEFAYATVVTTGALKKGEILTRENIWVKRPGSGPIPAERFESVLGKVATRDLPADVHLNPDDFI